MELLYYSMKNVKTIDQLMIIVKCMNTMK